MWLREENRKANQSDLEVRNDCTILKNDKYRVVHKKYLNIN